MDVHLTKFIEHLMLRQAEPLVPSCTRTLAHTSPQSSAQPHTTALTLPLVLPETHSQQDSTAAAGGQTQAEAEAVAASRGPVMFLCKSRHLAPSYKLESRPSPSFSYIHMSWDLPCPSTLDTKCMLCLVKCISNNIGNVCLDTCCL